jgi:hypothetical protein
MGAPITPANSAPPGSLHARRLITLLWGLLTAYTAVSAVMFKPAWGRCGISGLVQGGLGVRLDFLTLAGPIGDVPK